MLIDENRVSVRINQHQTGRTGGGFICLGRERKPLGFKAFLNLPNIGELVERLALGGPAWVKGECVAVKRPLEQADRDGSVPEDQPILGRVSHHLFESELFVEGLGGRQVLHGQTHGEGTECRHLFCHGRGDYNALTVPGLPNLAEFISHKFHDRET